MNKLRWLRFLISTVIVAIFMVLGKAISDLLIGTGGRFDLFLFLWGWLIGTGYAVFLITEAERDE